MGNVILTIDDIAPDRPLVAINGKDYPLFSQADFGLKDSAYLAKLGKAILAQVKDIDILEDDDLDALDTTLNTILVKILEGMTLDVITKVTYKHRLAILTAFYKTSRAEGDVTREAQASPMLKDL